MANEITTKKPTLLDIIGGDTFKQQIQMALPKHISADRFARITLTCMRKIPKLQRCTQESLFSALMTLSQYGLEPDGRRAHLIPFENRKAGIVECQLIIDYKGLVELALRSGLVSTLHADVVRDGDLFEYDRGRVVRHVPWFLRRDNAKPASPGDVYAVYALCINRDGTEKSDVLSFAEVEAIRSRSRAGNSGPWVTDWNEMAKKTALRRLSKWLVLSPEFRDAVDADDDTIIEATTVQRSSLKDLVSSIPCESEQSNSDHLLSDETTVDDTASTSPASLLESFKSRLSACNSGGEINSIMVEAKKALSPDDYEQLKAAAH